MDAFIRSAETPAVTLRYAIVQIIVILGGLTTRFSRLNNAPIDVETKLMLASYNAKITIAMAGNVVKINEWHYPHTIMMCGWLYIDRYFLRISRSVGWYHKMQIVKKRHRLPPSRQIPVSNPRFHGHTPTRIPCSCLFCDFPHPHPHPYLSSQLTPPRPKSKEPCSVFTVQGMFMPPPPVPELPTSVFCIPGFKMMKPSPPRSVRPQRPGCRFRYLFPRPSVHTSNMTVVASFLLSSCRIQMEQIIAPFLIPLHQIMN